MTTMAGGARIRCAGVKDAARTFEDLRAKGQRPSVERAGDAWLVVTDGEE